MFFSDLPTSRQVEAMPQVLHKNELLGRPVINRWMQIGFTITEILSISFAFFLLYTYRLSVEFGYVSLGVFLQNIPRVKEYGFFLFASLLSYIYWLYHFRLFQLDSFPTISFSDEITKVFRSFSYAILTSIGLAFLFKILVYSRLVILAFWVFGFAVICVIRLLRRMVAIRLSKRGLLTRNIVIVGAGKLGRLVAEEFASRSNLGYRIIGIIDDHKTGAIQEDLKIIGKTKDLKTIIRMYPVDEIIITIPSERGVVNKIIQEFRKYNLTIRIVPEMYNLVASTIEVGSIHAIPYVTLVKTPMRGLKLCIKRVVEWIAALCLLLVSLPIMLIIAIAIKLDSNGPVIYKQRRVGKNGKYFEMYKFRSMVVNADRFVKDLEKLNEADGPVFKMKNDPRVTRIGRIIRRYSLDELPQLFNVLKGEMALVGPRPPLPDEVMAYGDWEWRRLEVLPGITGLWQVSGRSDLSFEQWVNLDIYYIENWSFALDLKIVLKTLPAMMKGEGAY